MRALLLPAVLLCVFPSLGACDAVFPPAQTPACQRFVVCQLAIDARDRTQTDVGLFQPDGFCWQSSENAGACDATCQAALESLAEEPDAPAVCRPVSVSDSDA